MGGLRDRDARRRGRRRDDDPRHAAQLDSARRRRSTRSTAKRDGRARSEHRERRVHRRRRSGQRRPARRARATPASARSSASSSPSGVDEFPAVSRSATCARHCPCSPLGLPLMVHAEDPARFADRARRRVAHVRRLSRVAARRARNATAIALLVASDGMVSDAACTSFTSRRPSRSTSIRDARARGLPHHRRDLPALSHVRGRRDSRWRDGVQVRAADSRTRRARGAMGGADRRRRSISSRPIIRRVRRS